MVPIKVFAFERDLARRYGSILSIISFGVIGLLVGPWFVPVIELFLSAPENLRSFGHTAASSRLITAFCFVAAYLVIHRTGSNAPATVNIVRTLVSGSMLACIAISYLFIADREMWLWGDEIGGKEWMRPWRVYTNRDFALTLDMFLRLFGIRVYTSQIGFSFDFDWLYGSPNQHFLVCFWIALNFVVLRSASLLIVFLGKGVNRFNPSSISEFRVVVWSIILVGWAATTWAWPFTNLISTPTHELPQFIAKNILINLILFIPFFVVSFVAFLPFVRKVETTTSNNADTAEDKNSQS